MDDRSGCFLWVVGSAVLVALIVFAFWFFPQYGVWSAEMHGKGELSRAMSNRRVAVLEAEAKQAAAKALGAAEVERARGVAESVKIVGNALDQNPHYLRDLWVTEQAQQGNKTVIYIPTEAGLPILEAGKRDE